MAPITPKLIMVPGPTNVPDRVTQAMTRPIINHRSEAFKRLYSEIKEKVQRVFETSGEVVVLTSSGTGAVEASVTNMIRKGDKVVVPVFGEFSERLAESVSDAGGKVIRVSAPYGDAPSIVLLEEAFRGEGDVKALYVVYNETSTGVTYRWLKQAGEVAARYGSFFIVDAISILGGDELPVDRFGIDICITGSQKCLAAPPGLAILSISERAKNFMVKRPPPHLYFNLPRYFRYAERGETPFTPSLPLFYALDEALSMVIEEGLPNRIKRHKVCADAFYSAFGAMGLEMFAREAVRSNTVLSVKHADGVDDGLFRRALDEEHGVLIAGGFGRLRGRIFRIGSMGIVSRHHVLTTVKAISLTLNSSGLKNRVDDVLEAAEEKLKAL